MQHPSPDLQERFLALPQAVSSLHLLPGAVLTCPAGQRAWNPRFIVVFAGQTFLFPLIIF